MTHRGRGMIAVVSAAIMVVGGLGASSLACGRVLQLETTGDASSPSDAPFAASEDGDVRTDGSCANTANDPKNCGRCGNDCLVGSCVDGLCQPEKIASLGTPVRRLVHYGDSVYAVLRDGGPPRIVQIAKVAPFTPRDVYAPVNVTEAPNGGVAVSNDGFFWGTPNGLRRKRHGADTIEMIASGAPVYGVQVVGPDVVWTVFQSSSAPPPNQGKIGRCTAATCESSPSGNAVHYPSDAILVGGVTYWLGYGTSPGFFFHADLVMPTQYQGEQLLPLPMVADQRWIAWSTLNGISVFDTVTEQLGLALSTPLNERVNGIALETGRIYLTQRTEVLRCAFSNGACSTPEPLGKGDGEALDVLVDGRLLYWGTASGAIYRTRVP